SLPTSFDKEPKKDTFASSSRNAGTRSRRIFFYAQLVLFYM
ncbi:hypothetical protein HMPREF1359_00820, partial [Enterococcus faecium E417]